MGVHHGLGQLDNIHDDGPESNVAEALERRAASSGGHLVSAGHHRAFAGNHLRAVARRCKGCRHDAPTPACWWRCSRRAAATHFARHLLHARVLRVHPSPPATLQSLHAETVPKTVYHSFCSCLMPCALPNRLPVHNRINPYRSVSLRQGAPLPRGANRQCTPPAVHGSHRAHFLHDGHVCHQQPKVQALGALGGTTRCKLHDCCTFVAWRAGYAIEFLPAVRQLARTAS